jgi:outer membrane protein assembly factor BamB
VGKNITYPAIETGLVFAAGSDGVLTAFSTQCGADGAACSPIWSSVPLGDLTFPTASGGSVYVANYSLMKDSSQARLYAFDGNCADAGGTCRPTWTGREPGGVDFDQGPIVAGGSIFVPAASGLYAFATSCESAVCSPTWQALAGKEIHALAVGQKEVFVGTEHEVTAFPASCTSAKACSPLWHASMGSSPNRIVDTHGEVVVSTIGRNNGSGKDVYAFPVSCSRTCPPLWTGQTGGNGGFAAAEGSTVLVEDQQADLGGIFAFDVHCRSDGNRCQPLWYASAPDALAHDISVAGGVVYAGTQNGEVYAYPTGCSTPCEPIWTAKAGGHGDWVSPKAAGGMVFVGSDRLYAFEAPTL